MISGQPHYWVLQFSVSSKLMLSTADADGGIISPPLFDIVGLRGLLPGTKIKNGVSSLKE